MCSSDLFVGHARVERLWTGARWAEGPAWFAAGRYLLFSDIPNDRLMRFDETDGSVSVFRHPANNTNGNTVDRQGRLVSCEHRGRRGTRTEIDGSLTVLADRWNGRRFNSPNDLVVKSDGSVWFTDPGYGALQFPPQPAQLPNNVYRFDPKTNQLSVVEPGLVMPNGIAFGPGEKTLYIIDSGAIQGPRTYFPYLPHRIYQYNVATDGKSLTHKRLFANEIGRAHV